MLLKLRTVRAIVMLHLLPFPSERAEAACRRARHFGSYTYDALKKILRDGLDLEPIEGSPSRDWMTTGRYARSGAETIPPR